MTVTASLVVQLGDPAATDLLKAEIDGREDGFNEGNTSFIPGDDVHYLVYKGAAVSLTKHEATLGVISSQGFRTRQVTRERVQFAGKRTATLAYPVSSGLSVQWMGANPGAAQLQGDNTLVLPAAGLGYAEVTYTTRFEVFRLANLPGTVNGRADYAVLIRLVGEVAI